MKEFDKLNDVVAKLRDKKNGCPWDLKQTHISLVPNFIEELYECVEAIENCDPEHLSEELGDLMLHILMQARIAEEENNFDVKIVLNKITEKLIRRHPHIFGDGHAVDAEGVKLNWERIKQEEKKEHRKSAIDGIPRNMPALIIAQRMQEKAASVGFDWVEVEPALDKLKEEIDEFEVEFKRRDREEMEKELGDMLFSIVNIARKLNMDSETALKTTIRKFENRFKYVEEHFNNKEQKMQDVKLEKLDEIWDKAKEKGL